MTFSTLVRIKDQMYFYNEVEFLVNYEPYEQKDVHDYKVSKDVVTKEDETL